MGAFQRLVPGAWAIRARRRTAYQTRFVPSGVTPCSRSSQPTTSSRVRGSEQKARSDGATDTASSSISGVIQLGEVTSSALPKRP